jgi:hypothetical protein
MKRISFWGFDFSIKNFRELQKEKITAKLCDTMKKVYPTLINTLGGKGEKK